jgi:hypothetical protein
VLSSPLIVSRHARRSVLLPASRPSFHHHHSQPSKSHRIISFADPHPLTLLESYRFKNMAGRGYSLRSELRIATLPQLLRGGDPDPVGTFRRANFPHPPKSFPYHTSENSPVSPTIATLPKTDVSNPCVCHTSETPRGAPHSRIHTAQADRGAAAPTPSKPACTPVLSSALLPPLQPRKRARNDRAHP